MKTYRLSRHEADNRLFVMDDQARCYDFVFSLQPQGPRYSLELPEGLFEGIDPHFIVEEINLNVADVIIHNFNN